MLLLALALSNALLYACILPLWEGFDEPFHYGYVETLLVSHALPVAGRTQLTAEIRTSLEVTPLSRLLAHAIPGSVGFEQWAALTPQERTRRETAVAQIDPTLRTQRSDLLNYEAQQAPLAYLLLAPFDAALGNVPLSARILLLRIFCATAAVCLAFFGLLELSRALELRQPFAFVALACALEAQMFCASISHVGNDWLAIPLTIWFLALIAQERQSLLPLSIVLTVGLLTKAYFLAFAPVFLVLVVAAAARKRTGWHKTLAAALIPVVGAGWWYLRNEHLYGSLSGTQESVAGVAPGQLLHALQAIPWWTSAFDFLRWSLWTGNWSFLSFSKATLDGEALLLCIGVALWLFLPKGKPKQPVWFLAACSSFLLGLVYQTCVTWVNTRGASKFPEPWYWQGVVCCLWLLSLGGWQRIRAGRLAAIGVCCLSAWILLSTYIVKLLPYYSAAVTRSTLPAVFQFWRRPPVLTTLSPTWLVYAMLSATLLCVMAATAVGVRRLLKPEPA